MKARAKAKPYAPPPFSPPDWPATRPEMWPMAKIIPYPLNPRSHPPAQVTMLAGMMQRHGVDQPIAVDEEGVILKGHGRRLAALEAGFEEYPVVVHHGLPEVEKRAMRLQDNQVALLSTWDKELIQGEIGTLKIEGYDIPTLGFTEVALRGWGVDGAGENATSGDPEDTPPVPTKPVVRLGDLWVLGDHRLICGDATQPATWTKLFGTDKASMVFTDPPYGVSYEAQSGKFGVIKGDAKRRDDLFKMLVGAFKLMAKHAGGDAGMYIWHASSTREDFAQAMKAAGIFERQYLIWAKPSIVLGHADYSWQHEPCFYASVGDRRPAFYGERAEGTVWHVEMVATKDIAATVGTGVMLLDGKGNSLYVQSSAPKSKKLRQIRIDPGSTVLLSGSDRQDTTVWQVARDTSPEHPTQKPVELARRAIENSSRPSEIVADPFLGSSTTLIGAEMTTRRCYGSELDPAYCDVGILRWQKFTGRAAMLGDKTFDEVAKQRRKAKPEHARRGARRDAAPA